MQKISPQDVWADAQRGLGDKALLGKCLSLDQAAKPNVVRDV